MEDKIEQPAIQMAEKKRPAYEVILDRIEGHVATLEKAEITRARSDYAALSSLTKVLSEIVISDSDGAIVGSRVVPVLQRVIDLHTAHLDEFIEMDERQEKGDSISWLQTREVRGA